MTKSQLAAAASVLALGVGLAVQAQPAFAQAASGTTKPAAANEVEEVVITGSRIARRDYSSSSPIITTDIQKIQESGRVNLEDALVQMPQFVPAQNGTTNPLGGGGRATLNLRGLGEQRGLILLDGHRLPISASDGIVDINLIPRDIVGSVEVITGGASTVYGSDAISGVVNFKTVSSRHGLNLDAQYGQSDSNDARTYALSLSYGDGYADGRGDFLVSASYNKRDELLGAQRSFFNNGGTASSFLSSSVYIPAGNNVNQAQLNALFTSYGAGAPVANSGNLSFNDDGTLFARAGGRNFRGDTDRFRVIAGNLGEMISRDATIVTPQDRYSIYAKTKYAISDKLNAFGSALYTSSEVRMATGYMSTQPLSLSVPVTNPFLASSALAPLLATRPNPNAPIVVNTRFMEAGKRYYDEHYDTYQVLGGLNGELQIKDWKWEAIASVDRTRNREALENAVRDDRVQNLMSAPDGGASICRGGFNPFGLKNALSISQECLNYMAGTVRDATTVSQYIAEGTIQGGLFDLPAGEVRFAATADYHRTHYKTTVDRDLQIVPGTTHSNIESTAPITPTSGSTNVKELSAELLVPLLADLPMVKVLNADLGYRYSDYNLSGGTSTYKADLEWRPVQDLLVRGGFAHAIRAPNVGELFSQATLVAQIGSAPQQGDPCDRASVVRAAHPAQVQAICNAQTPFPDFINFQAASNAIGQARRGNTSLKPETADTYTYGFAWQPKFESPLFDKVSLSVDYYNVKIEQAISNLSGAGVLAKCFNTDGSNPNYDPNSAYCKLISRDPSTAQISIINTPYLNLGLIKTHGIDAQVDWTTDLGSAGGINFNVAYNHLGSYQVQTVTGGRIFEYKGTVTPVAQATPPLPKDKWLAMVTYKINGMSIGGRWQHYAAMKDVSSVTSATPLPGVQAYDLFDVFGRASIGSKAQLRMGVNNLFDKGAPVVGASGGQTQTNAQLYDIVGRSYYFGVNVQF